MPANGKYKSAAVVAATKIPIETFNRWLDHNVCDADDKVHGKRYPRLFGLDRGYKTASGHELTQALVPPTAAMSLAQLFLDQQCGRALGRRFAIGKTIMLISG